MVIVLGTKNGGNLICRDATNAFTLNKAAHGRKISTIVALF